MVPVHAPLARWYLTELSKRATVVLDSKRSSRDSLESQLDELNPEIADLSNQVDQLRSALETLTIDTQLPAVKLDPF